jgi:hypothetical protein
MTLVHRDASTLTLARAELVVAALWFLKTAWTPWGDVGELPFDLFQPVGFHRWLPSAWWPALLDGGVLEALRFLALAALLATRWRPARAWGFLLAGVVIAHHQAIIHGFGFVNHQELVSLYALFVFGGFALAAPNPRPGQAGVPIVIVLAILCFTYVLAGVYRIVVHPEIIRDPGSMMGWILLNSARPLFYGWNIGLDLPWSPALAWATHAGFLLVNVLELLAPLALVWRPFRWLFLAVMVVPFHVGCLLLMNIFFWENGVLLLLFFDWARLGGRSDP